MATILDGPIDRSTARHDVKRHSCRGTSRLSELIWRSFQTISFWALQDIICWTDLSSTNKILDRRTRSVSTGRLGQNGQTRPRGALKDVKLACEPWPVRRG